MKINTTRTNNPQTKEKGFATLDQVKEDVTLKAKQEKKAEQFMTEFSSKAANAKSVDEYATKLGLTVQNADNMNFNSYSIPNVGRDDVFTGAISALKVNATTKPFKGNLGVFVATLASENVTPAKDYKESQKAVNLAAAGRVDYEVFEALKKLADIEDHKARFDF